MKRFAMLALCAAGMARAAVALSGVEIYSNESVHYGRWEIRMKAAAAPGTVSSFFTYYPNSYLGSPTPWSEIDIEVLGNNPAGFQSNLITGYAEAKLKKTAETFHATSADVSQGFHTYVLDWTPDSVVWRLDGTTVRKATGAQVTSLRDSFETYRMNVWASKSEEWVGALDTTKLPVLQVVNWIAYSQYTPGAGSDGGDFTPSWTDDFTSLDGSRWSFGDWSFDGNYATFTTKNAKVVNGYLVMMLSTQANAGKFPAVLPVDSLGSSRPITGISGHDARRAGQVITVRSLGGGSLSLEVPQGGAAVLDSQGRVLARRDDAGLATLSGLPHGIVFVRTAAAIRTVFVD